MSAGVGDPMRGLDRQVHIPAVYFGNKGADRSTRLHREPLICSAPSRLTGHLSLHVHCLMLSDLHSKARSEFQAGARFHLSGMSVLQTTNADALLQSSALLQEVLEWHNEV